MNYSIQELVENINASNINPMIPILIGKTKSVYKETLNFIDNNKTQLQLLNTNNVLIDETSLLVAIKSWNLKTDIFDTTIVSGINEITCGFTLIERMPKSSIYIIMDNSNNIIFSSTIEEFVWEGPLDLQKIILTNAPNVDGSYKVALINLETRTITGTFNSYSNILTVNTDFIFKTPSLNYIYDTAFLTYIGSSRVYSVTYHDQVTQDTIDDEQNHGIKAGLILNEAAIIISYPDETYINDLLEDLAKMDIGYYVVPIDLTSMNILASYIKTESKFYCLMISTEDFSSIKIISNQVFEVVYEPR